MDFAKISRLGGEIYPSEIEALIESRGDLQPLPVRSGINPFTREPTVFRPPPGAMYQPGGERRGNLTLEEGVVLTTGIPKSVVVELADTLNAEWSEDDRS